MDAVASDSVFDLIGLLMSSRAILGHFATSASEETFHVAAISTARVMGHFCLAVLIGSIKEPHVVGAFGAVPDCEESDQDNNLIEGIGVSRQR